MAIAQRIDIPSLPNASVRRGKPAPFSRPSISIGGGAAVPEKREWQTILACDIKEGDIIPGVGRVYQVDEQVCLPQRKNVLREPDAEYYTSWTVTVRGGVDNERVFQGNEEVLAFTTRAGG